MVVKTFRGVLADGGQERIRLQTIKGKVGYKIVKFQMMITNYGSNRGSFVQIWKNEVASVSTGEPDLNFTDSDLLATALQIYQASNLTLSDQTIIFDNEVFNQDIFITHTERSGGGSANYYLELEVIPLDDAGAEYTTLKDMRQT